jgi:hypothetical protein
LATGVAHSFSKAMGSFFPSSNGTHLCRCACSRHFVIGVTFRADRPRVAFGHSGSCCTENPKVLHPCLMLWQAEMKFFAQRNSPLHGPRSLLEWNRWFAWYPVPLVIDGNLHYAWLQTVERKWGTSRYSGTIKWRAIGSLHNHVGDRSPVEIIRKIGFVLLNPQFGSICLEHNVLREPHVDSYNRRRWLYWQSHGA